MKHAGSINILSQGAVAPAHSQCWHPFTLLESDVNFRHPTSTFELFLVRRLALRTLNNRGSILYIGGGVRGTTQSIVNLRARPAASQAVAQGNI
jgi:hypothetical protein